VSSPNLQISALSSLGDHAQEWDDLVASTTLPSPFLRTWWLQAMAADGEPCHLLATTGEGTLVGGAALLRDRRLGVSRYRFLGQGTLCPDHLDLVARPGHETEVARAFAGWFRGGGSRVLDLDGLRSGSLLAAGLGVVAQPGEAAPYQPLPATYDEYVASLSASFRRGRRRSERKLAEAGVVHEAVTPAGLARAQEAFWELHRRRGDRTRILAESAVLDRAVAAGLARDEAQVDLLRTPEQVVAVSIGFRVAGRLSLYQLARTVDAEHASAGTVLLARALERAIAAGCHEADFLRGEEGYKAHFAQASRELGSVRVGHGAGGRALVAGEDAARRALTALRRARRSA
jgi:CelD/BcsL family acetyltransferase involved in cellulose biosynthesis